jgi:hypothetical protein
MIETRGGRENMKKHFFIIGVMFFLVAAAILSQETMFPEFTGSFLGRKPPGVIPEIFAKEFMGSKHRTHGAPAFSPDLKEVYWSIFPNTDEFSTRTQVIVFSEYNNGRWTLPKLAGFSGKYFDGGPVFSYDGNRLYFYSRRPLHESSDQETDGEIWYVEKQGDVWGQPQHLAIDIDGEKLFFSLSKKNNLYFTTGHGPRGVGLGSVDIYCAQYNDGSYSQPVKLPHPINSTEYIESDALISPEEEYLIFYSFKRPGNFGQYDLYVSFKTGERWTNPINLGQNINKGYSRFPGFSLDGRVLFFIRRDGVYWVSVEIIQKLKPRDLKYRN